MIPQRKIHILNIDQLIELAVSQWRDVAKKAIKDHNVFLVGLSGGKTPQTLYKVLGRDIESVLWQRTHIFFVDERFVPAGHKDSNYRMVRTSLLDHIDIPDANVHNINTFSGDIHRVAESYSLEIRQAFNLSEKMLPRFDLLILGIGEDGHTASLFPELLPDPNSDSIAASVISSSLPQNRITLTMPVINNSANASFFVTGERKAGILKEILEKEASLPAGLVNPNSGRCTFFIDNAAASLLSPPKA